MKGKNKDKMCYSSKIKAVSKTVLSTCIAVITLAAVFSLTGCVKDELHNTPHPDKGAVVVQMDWSNLLPEAVADSYILNVDGYEQTVSGTTNTVEQLAEPGEHSLMVYNKPDGITISGNMASVDEETGTRAAGTRIKPLPGYLLSLNETIRIVADDTLRITAKPRQWVRQLELELSVREGDYEWIASVTGTLSGVERSVNIRKGERTGTAAQVRNVLVVEGSLCKTTFRLMGIVPAAGQILTVQITFSNGDTQTEESDLTEQMAAFNNGNTPLKLTGNLRLPVKAGTTGSITGWQQADGGNTDAH